MADAVIANLKTASEEEYTTAKWREILQNIGDVHRAVTCRHCHRTNRVPVPNIDAIVKLLDRAFGKPAESKTVELIDHRKVSAIYELSEAELQALVLGDAVIDVEEAEWTEGITRPPELPPAA